MERSFMLRFGAVHDHVCDMDLDHIFFSRLKLLIIMMRAYLEGYPLGAVRTSAIVDNAAYISAESIDLEQLIPPAARNPPRTA
jgi:hypothetical protein